MTKEKGIMKAVNSPAKPIGDIVQGVHVMLGTRNIKLDFSIVPLDDFNMVLGMEFFDQVHAFSLLATNSLSIIDRDMSGMVLAERTKTGDKTFTTM